ncbi:hypothetical protein BU16DRAFT_620840 [Lophium mytilinum]|uniref:F-box domain-containing protein n=1 Tax=Lophium mytilinum TaxID=390894 RepID=A0A6A6QJP4_9PEZI|nr:hypothetical protein BU16DRAFT_620840 [Lophium mytilinum]
MKEVIHGSRPNNFPLSLSSVNMVQSSESSNKKYASPPIATLFENHSNVQLQRAPATIKDLPEEILTMVKSETLRKPSKTALVSHKFHRCTQEAIYHDISLEAFGEETSFRKLWQLFRTLNTTPGLGVKVRDLSVKFWSGQRRLQAEQAVPRNVWKLLYKTVREMRLSDNVRNSWLQTIQESPYIAFLAGVLSQMPNLRMFYVITESGVPLLLRQLANEPSAPIFGSLRSFGAYHFDKNQPIHGAIGNRLDDSLLRLPLLKRLVIVSTDDMESLPHFAALENASAVKEVCITGVFWPTLFSSFFKSFQSLTRLEADLSFAPFTWNQVVDSFLSHSGTIEHLKLDVHAVKRNQQGFRMLPAYEIRAPVRTFVAFEQLQTLEVDDRVLINETMSPARAGNKIALSLPKSLEELVFLTWHYQDEEDEQDEFEEDDVDEDGVEADEELEDEEDAYGPWGQEDEEAEDEDEEEEDEMRHDENDISFTPLAELVPYIPDCLPWLRRVVVRTYCAIPEAEQEDFIAIFAEVGVDLVFEKVLYRVYEC